MGLAINDNEPITYSMALKRLSQKRSDPCLTQSRKARQVRRIPSPKLLPADFKEIPLLTGSGWVVINERKELTYRSYAILRELCVFSESAFIM